MKWVYPDYYKQFQCIADRCRHNCCIGWEIDIDYSSMMNYNKMKGPMGDRLRSCIAGSALDGHFILAEGDRCPLLNERGMCDLIIAKSEKSLCQICRDHPRFRFRLTDREEIGLGLCCEEACRLILNQTEPMKLILEDNGRSKAVPNSSDLYALEKREKMLVIATDRSVSVEQRMELMLEADDTSIPDIPFKNWVDILLNLERLDETWTKLLISNHSKQFGASINEITQENLLAYFLYRYCVKETRAGDYSFGVIPFCVLSTKIIATLCDKQADVYEIARMYSAEIEYSYDNLYGLMGMLDEYNGGTEE